MPDTRSTLERGEEIETAKTSEHGESKRWRDISSLPYVNNEYDFLMSDGTVRRGVMLPNGTFVDWEGDQLSRPQQFRYDIQEK